MFVNILEKENLIIPTNAHEGDAGYDIIAASDPLIVGNRCESHQGAWHSVDYIEYKTNIFLAPLEKNVHILIFPRSSISKYNLQLCNGIGLCDNGYRGMITCRLRYIFQPEDLIIKDFGIVGLINYNKIYQRGDKIAQLVIQRTYSMEFVLVQSLDTTERGEGGYGSSDKK